MIAFEVFLNNKHIATIGREDLCVLHTIISGVGKLGKNSKDVKDGDGKAYLSLNLSGLASEVKFKNKLEEHHTDWGKFELNVNDKISINIIETNQADQPDTIMNGPFFLVIQTSVGVGFP